MIGKLDNFHYKVGSVRLQPEEKYRSRVDKGWKMVKNWSDQQAGMQVEPFPATAIKDFFARGHGFEIKPQSKLQKDFLAMTADAEDEWTQAKNTTTEGDLTEGKDDVQSCIAKEKAAKRTSTAD